MNANITKPSMITTSYNKQINNTEQTNNEIINNTESLNSIEQTGTETIKNGKINRHILKILLCSIMFIGLSIHLGFYLSELYSRDKINYNRPIFIAGWQNVGHYIISTLMLSFLKLYYWYNTPYKKSVKAPKPKYNFKYIKSFLYSLLGPISSCLDTSLSLKSLRNISLFTYTMVKSSSPIFLLFNGFLLGIEQVSSTKIFSVGCIALGVFMSTFKSQNNNRYQPKQIGIVLIASLIGGFRWAFTGSVLEKRSIITSTTKYKGSTFYKSLKTINNFSLPTFIFLFTISLFTESSCTTINTSYKLFDKSSNILGNITAFAMDTLKTNLMTNIDTLRSLLNSETVNRTAKHKLPIVLFNHTPFIVIYSTVLSFIILMLEYIVISESSVMILSIIGIVKEILILGVALVKKEESLEMMNIFGVGMAIIGVGWFGYIKSKDNKINIVDIAEEKNVKDNDGNMKVVICDLKK